MWGSDLGINSLHISDECFLPHAGAGTIPSPCMLLDVEPEISK